MRLIRPALLTLLALSALCASAQEGAGTFPPPPSEPERQARNDGEREAGLVVMETELSLRGAAAMGWTKMKGTVRRTYRYRYLVLDAKGVEEAGRHTFLGDVGSKIKSLSARTIAPSGEIFPVDPVKDVKDLDVRDTLGKPKAPVKTVHFPHVEPGAVLDLFYVHEDDEVPDVEEVALQLSYPVRKLHFTSEGHLLGAFYWVPFFIGKTPERARATLTNDFNLDLAVEDLPALRDEAFAPPRTRTGAVLVFWPRALARKERLRGPDGVPNAVLFGPPSVTRSMMGSDTHSAALDPKNGMQQFDELALQVLPAWSTDETLMEWWQRDLKLVDASFEKFFRRGVPEAAEVAAAGAPDLPVEERARRLYAFVRERVKPDPDAKNCRNLEKLLAQGKGGEWDLALYYSHVLEKAGIPNRIVLGFSRMRPAFHPTIESFRVFASQIFVKIPMPGAPARYLIPGDPFADFDTFPSAYLGGVGFEQPAVSGQSWSLVRLPADLPTFERGEVAFRAKVPPEGADAELSVDASLTGSTAYIFRWGLGWDKPVIEAGKPDPRKEHYDKFLDSWANLKSKGDPPALDPRSGVGEPLRFSLKADWKPDIQEVGNRLLLPAFPNADYIRNFLKEPRRTNPLWLYGGSYRVQMTWELPAGATVVQPPKPAEVTGPGGLSARFRFEAAAPPGEAATVVAVAEVRIPEMLPATEYEGAKTFFEQVQRLGESRLMVDLPAATP